ncbi:MAG: hypothetical protein AUH78_05605 [Gemmatimonadetes bacterium 13_1_40CM_4_69_8]|nr:MAG: hypothetical protein AUH78_05605 [Gemmatimonadetes bacterium 13_1_40CM_4_69_8]
MAKVSGDSQVGAGGVTLTPFSVVVKDANGSPVANATVSWAVVAGGGSIASSGLTDASGLSTGTLTLGPNAGTQGATATHNGLSGSPVTFTSFSQIQGATSIQANGGGGQSDTVLATLATPMSVIVRDYKNVPVAGVSVNWSVTGGGSVGQAATTTGAGGIGSVSRTLTATAGNATQMALNGGNNQTGSVNTALATPHSVLVSDGHGNAKSGVTVTWAVGDGGGTVSFTSPVTGGNGVASVMRTLGPSAGTNTDTARVNGLTGSPVVFTATATPPAAAVSLVNNSFSPSSLTIASGTTVTWTWNCNPCNAHNVHSTSGPASFNSGNTTAVNGTTFSFTFTTAGSYTYQCDVHFASGMTGTITVQ